DISNSRTAVMGSAAMGRTTIRQGAAANALTDAEHACLRARQLTWQLLTFSQGGIPSRKTVKLAHVIDESVDIALRGSNVALRLDLAPDLWTVDADHAQLVQVFSNILMNAWEAMRQGGTIVIRAEKVVGSWRH